MHYYGERGQSTDEKLDHIGEHAQRVAPSGEESTNAQRAIRRVSYNYAAYAKHAHNGRRRLEQARAQIKQSVEAGEQYGSLAEYFGVMGTPAYEGPGQLTRYVDAVFVLADNTDDDHEKYAFAAKLDKNAANESVIADPSIAARLDTQVQQHQREVLGLVPMELASQLISYAMYNETRREQFWESRLHEARRDHAAAPIANAALRSLSV
jgi:hypothetical protein